MSAGESASAWLQKGLEALAMAHTADYSSEYKSDHEDAVAAFDRAIDLDASATRCCVPNAQTSPGRLRQSPPPVSGSGPRESSTSRSFSVPCGTERVCGVLQAGHFTSTLALVSSGSP
jgi:hypothetical protein